MREKREDREGRRGIQPLKKEACLLVCVCAGTAGWCISLPAHIIGQVGSPDQFRSVQIRACPMPSERFMVSISIRTQSELSISADDISTLALTANQVFELLAWHGRDERPTDYMKLLEDVGHGIACVLLLGNAC